MSKIIYKTMVVMGVSLLMSGAAVAQSTSWAGPYVGGSVGAVSMSTNFLDFDDAFDNEGLSGHRKVRPSVGIFGGYNIQQGSLVYGVDLSADYHNNQNEAQPSDVGPGDQQLHAKLRGSFSIKARVGAALGNSLIYVAAGPAFGKFKLFNEDGGDFGNASSTRTGLAAAVGIDSKIDKNLMLRVQIEYRDFGTQKVTNTNDDRFGQTSSTLSGIIGLAYKF